MRNILASTLLEPRFISHINLFYLTPDFFALWVSYCSCYIDNVCFLSTDDITASFDEVDHEKSTIQEESTVQEDFDKQELKTKIFRIMLIRL